MIVDSAVFFDLLKLIVNINTEKTHKTSDKLFDVYSKNMGTLSSREIKYCELYISLIKEVISHQLNRDTNRVDIRNLFQRYTDNQLFRKDQFILDALRDIVEAKVPPLRLAEIAKRLSNIVSWYQSKEYVNQLDSQLRACKLAYNTGDQSVRIDNIKDLVTDFRKAILDMDSDIGKGGPIEVIDFSNKVSIGDAIKTFKDRRVTGKIVTGLQGINQMVGGSIGLGETVCFAARSHHYKSGIISHFPNWCNKYVSVPDTQGKVPMILYITLENEGYMNMIGMFRKLYISTKGEKPPPDMSDTELVEAIYEHFNSGPYQLVIHRYLGSNFGYDELVRTIEQFENSGYKVILCCIDYVALMKTHSGSVSKTGDHMLLQKIFSDLCNYFKAIGTTLVTAHQLNRTASDIVSSGIPHPVKKFNESHLANSTGIFREPDKFIFIEIEKDEEGNSWLTCAFGKARYQDDIPEAHKFCAYPFQGDKGIVDDINDKPGFVRDIYKKKVDKLEGKTVEDILGIKR